MFFLWFHSQVFAVNYFKFLKPWSIYHITHLEESIRFEWSERGRNNIGRTCHGYPTSPCSFALRPAIPSARPVSTAGPPFPCRKANRNCPRSQFRSFKPGGEREADDQAFSWKARRDSGGLAGCGSCSISSAFSYLPSLCLPLAPASSPSGGKYCSAPKSINVLRKSAGRRHEEPKGG